VLRWLQAAQTAQRETGKLTSSCRLNSPFSSCSSRSSPGLSASCENA
jgi:hypothetical protein